MYKASAQQYKLGFWDEKERISVLNTSEDHKLTHHYMSVIKYRIAVGFSNRKVEPLIKFASTIPFCLYGKKVT